MKRTLILSLLMVFALSVDQPVAQAQKIIPPNLKFGDPLPANAFVELAKAVNPAIVNISTSILPRGRGRGGAPGRDPFFDMLEQMYGFRMQQPRQMKPQTALGTGFVIREDGLIVTNNHVISGADKIQVQFEEKSDKFFEAKVVGSDERTDIALIKIEGGKFPTLQLGSSNDAQVGEWVAAFGNPFGNGHTITKGIISAKGRDIGEINKFPLIQTDAPINPGNSGGPLINLKGYVIGVNSAIDARAQGIGFAIPIDEVKNILPQLEKSGRIKKAYLGVGLADLDPQTAEALGMESLSGAVITQVEPGMPAQKGGIQPYDIVTEFNGKKIESSSQLSDSVGDATVGSDAKIKVLRDGKPKALTIKLVERPDVPRRMLGGPAPKKAPSQEAPHSFGFMLSDPTPQLRQEFNLEADVKKPIVTDLIPGSPAATAGLLPGDIILDVNRKEVNSATDAMKGLKKGSNTLRVSRQGSVLLLMIRS